MSINYGPEWEKEMMRCTKAELVCQLRLNVIADEHLADTHSALEGLAATVAMFAHTARRGKIVPSVDILEKALRDAGQGWRI